MEMTEEAEDEEAIEGEGGVGVLPAAHRGIYPWW
jgi:hypothetical protein